MKYYIVKCFIHHHIYFFFQDIERTFMDLLRRENMQMIKNLFSHKLNGGREIVTKYSFRLHGYNNVMDNEINEDFSVGNMLYVCCMFLYVYDKCSFFLKSYIYSVLDVLIRQIRYSCACLFVF